MSKINILDVLDKAVSNGASEQVILGLIEMQERAEKDLKTQSFNVAMSFAKAQIKPITKDQRVDNGAGGWEYASFAQVQKAIDAVITELDLSYRFRCDQVDDKVTVVCVVSHGEGHYEETRLTATVEKSEQLTSSQAIAAVVTALSRLTVMAAFGLAAVADTDGVVKKVDKPKISEKQIKEIRHKISETKLSEERLLRLLKVDKLEDLPADQLEAAILLINNARFDEANWPKCFED
jgi:hypothetical protein